MMPFWAWTMPFVMPASAVRYLVRWPLHWGRA